jgi:hypothetical protein
MSLSRKPKIANSRGRGHQVVCALCLPLPCGIALASCSGNMDLQEDVTNRSTMLLTASAPPDFAPESGEKFCLLVEVARNADGGPRKEIALEVDAGGESQFALEGMPAGHVTVKGTLFDAAPTADDSCGGVERYTGAAQTFLRPNGEGDVTLRLVPIDSTLHVDLGYESLGEAENESCDGSEVSSWSESFDSDLGPEWNVFDYGGPRNNGQTSPANHYSLTENPGTLRYALDPMTATASSLGYEPRFDGTWYWYDPGVELSRELGGSDWQLDVTETYAVPLVVNAAHFETAVRFDSSGPLEAGCFYARYSNDDVGQGTNPEHNYFSAGCSFGGSWTSWAGLETSITRAVRFVRSANVLSVLESADGDTWTELVRAEIPEELRCVRQELQISGGSWFSPAGSYVDIDAASFVRND